VDIFFRNFDVDSHRVDVKFEMIGEREWKERTPQDIIADEGYGNLEDAVANV
jgi:hypothetical protein